MARQVVNHIRQLTCFLPALQILESLNFCYGDTSNEATIGFAVTPLIHYRTIQLDHYSTAPNTSASSAIRITTPLNASCQ